MKDCCRVREIYLWQTRYLDRSPPGVMEEARVTATSEAQRRRTGFLLRRRAASWAATGLFLAVSDRFWQPSGRHIRHESDPAPGRYDPVWFTLLGEIVFL